ncbi:MAG: hypothetical protein NZ853_06735 [Leptospiraceae bacterium]|nr:hypothetical protein [Leptospiraceae bacterium]MDW7975871.1 hypothetical protein [Leptospiraceae bacterium]
MKEKIKSQNQIQDFPISLNGLIVQYFFLMEFKEELQSNEISSEFIPQRAFQMMSMEFRKNLTLILTFLFLDMLIVLYLISYLNGLSFSIKFRKLLLILILVVLLIDVFLIRKVESSTEFFFLDLKFFSNVLDSLFLFMTTFYIFEKEPHTPQKKYLDFLLKKDVFVFNLNKQYLLLFRDFSIIIFIALVVVNILLFPLFLFQIHYDSLFGMIVIVSLLFLFWFYLRTYSMVSKQKEGSSHWYHAVLFLGYRFLNNFFFFSIIILSIFLVGMFISFAILLNSQILEFFGLVQEHENL